MPNHVKNRVEFIGSLEEIKKLIERFSTSFERTLRKAEDGRLIYENKTTGKFGWRDEKENKFEFGHDRGKIVSGIPEGYEQDFDEAWVIFPDFNKIIPMPPTLQLTSGSLGENAHALLFGTVKEKYFPTSIEEKQERFSKLSVEDQKEAVALAIQYQDNLIKYGHTTWYDWSIEHWGTKWNSYSCERINDTTFQFETAWSGVPNLIELMSKEFPNVTILYKYSDEDTGCNCGIGEYKGGEVYFKELENSSKEAYDLAFELRPDYKENYKLVGDNYEYVEED